MAAWEPAVGKEGVAELVQYVLNFTGRATRPEWAGGWPAEVRDVCFSCHRISGKGNPAVGAPDLTNDIWQYGGSEPALTRTISGGRKGMMPAHGEFLGPAKVRLLTAYVYGLSKGS